MLPVFPTSYFGSIAYFKEVCKYDKIAIESKETYPKQTLRNRTVINTSNGHLRLTVPVEKPRGSRSITGEIMISDNGKWRAEHWRAIKTAYSSAPYFDHYGMEIEELIHSEKKDLVEFNTSITTRILDWLSFKTEITFTDDFIEHTEINFRNGFNDSKDTDSPYTQVFETEPFNDSLSILDVILCEGPLARNLLLL